MIRGFILFVFVGVLSFYPVFSSYAKSQTQPDNSILNDEIKANEIREVIFELAEDLYHRLDMSSQSDLLTKCNPSHSFPYYVRVNLAEINSRFRIEEFLFKVQQTSHSLQIRDIIEAFIYIDQLNGKDVKPVNVCEFAREMGWSSSSENMATLSRKMENYLIFVVMMMEGNKFRGIK